MKHVWRNYTSTVEHESDNKADRVDLSNCDFVYYGKTYRTKHGKLIKAGTFDTVKMKGVEPEFKTVEKYVQTGGVMFNGRPKEVFKVKNVILRKAVKPVQVNDEQVNKTYVDARLMWE
jgi:hypothetical protein